MRHLKKGRKLSRKIGPRKALIKGLGKALILNEKITTTEAKAKELRSFVERLITIGKKQNLHARRLIIQRTGDERVAAKILEVLAPKYKDRPGGYTRIIKLGPRKGDGARLVQMELV